MTVHLNDFFAVTIRPPRKVAANAWTALGDIFRRDTMQTVSQVSGEGTTGNAAKKDVEREARHWARKQGVPPSWKPPSAGKE